MTCYSIQPRVWTLVKGYGFMCFAKKTSKRISKNISGKYSHKFLYHVKASATDAVKTTSKRAIQKTA